MPKHSHFRLRGWWTAGSSGYLIKQGTTVHSREIVGTIKLSDGTVHMETNVYNRILSRDYSFNEAERFRFVNDDFEPTRPYMKDSIFVEFKPSVVHKTGIDGFYVRSEDVLDND